MTVQTGDIWRLDILFENGSKWFLHGDQTRLIKALTYWEEFRGLENGDPILHVTGYTNTADQAPNIVGVDMRNICGMSVIREY